MSCHFRDTTVGRNAIGVELNQNYTEIIQKRLDMSDGHKLTMQMIHI